MHFWDVRISVDFCTYMNGIINTQIKLDVNSRQQSFFRGHTGTVVAIATSCASGLLATAQVIHLCFYV